MTKLQLHGRIAELERENRRLADELRREREQIEILVRRRARQQGAADIEADGWRP